VRRIAAADRCARHDAAKQEAKGLRRLDFSRFALGLPICAALSLHASAAIAQLLPGVKLCSLTDSSQTLASERADLQRNLPRVIGSFEIVPHHGDELRVVVPFETWVEAQKHVSGDKIRDIWELVLSKHHPKCGYAYLSVEFVGPNRKELITENVTR
jgi:hypothetical protein